MYTSRSITALEVNQFWSRNMDNEEERRVSCWSLKEKYLEKYMVLNTKTGMEN
jgi:hypothetical protein